MEDVPITIVIRSFNEGWALEKTLNALKIQHYDNWELIVIDSGSTDGSVELIRAAQPKHFIQIPSSEYHSSRVLNHGMELARTEYVVFLNADATPVDGNWLRPLVEGLQDKRNAAVFGKQIPRPNCRAVYMHDYERCFGDHRESTKWDHFFSMVSSGIRKDIWSRRGFSEKLRYSEDDEYTRWCVSQGWRVVYCPESVVMHSHNYTPEETFRRHYGEGEALARISPEELHDMNMIRFCALGCFADFGRDLLFCARQRCLDQWPHAVRIRAIQRWAKYSGFHHSRAER